MMAREDRDKDFMPLITQRRLQKAIVATVLKKQENSTLTVTNTESRKARTLDMLTTLKLQIIANAHNGSLEREFPL